MGGNNMCNSGFTKKLRMLLLSIFSFFTIFSGCEKNPVQEEITPPDQADLNIYVGFPTPGSGTLQCDVYNNPDFSGDPDWSKSTTLTEKSGVELLVVSIRYEEVTDKNVYLRVFLDEDANGDPNGDELCEFYGNISHADVTSGRTSTPIAYSEAMSADVILDKKFNDSSSPAPKGLEVNTFYTDAVVGDYLFCLVFKGSQKETWKPEDWMAEVVQIENTSDITQFLVADITGETEVYFLIESQPVDEYGPPADGLYFEYYNNKTVDDAQNDRCNTLPVNSAIDVILDVKS